MLEPLDGAATVIVKEEVPLAAKPEPPKSKVHVPVEPETKPVQLTVAVVPAVLLALYVIEEPKPLGKAS